MREQYLATFRQLCASHYRSVPGVMEVRAKQSGPTAAILVCTHGNEPAGLGAIRYMLSDLTLQKGRVLFIVMNRDATQAYFNAATEEDAVAHRYVHFNMNRLPHDLAEWEGSSEGDRLKALLPVLQEIDGGVLDLHSTSSDAPPMLITCDEAGCETTNCPSLPFQHIIHGVCEYLRGEFVIQVCKQAPLRLLAECGQHSCPQASSRAIEVSLAFLAKLGIVEPPISEISEQERPVKYHYRVKSAVRIPPDQGGFHLIRPIEPFERLNAGQPIATNGTKQIKAEMDGYAIMCPQTDAALCDREALLFLCDRAEA